MVKQAQIGSIMPKTLEELRGEAPVLAKWYKTLKVTHELVIQLGGNATITIPLKKYPTDEEVATAVKIAGGRGAKIVTTSVETKPYELIDAEDVDMHYGYHDELRDSPVHIFSTAEIRKAVLERMKEDME
ncbi:hypothetical protein Spock_171 [Bacillus phage Spock]|uniref:Uncharacterized protein n=1 Tax=Bacillus phage Spock TaxID=1406791 RepID=U5PXT3_9CAUD|nr:hypothetical protein Spock_171 [Bacillus phage Spock]AGY48571.1 hypothetical protein Spock_171 [Bacillus phage Spock]